MPGPLSVPLLSKRNKKLRPPLPDAIWQNPLYFLAFGLGSGCFKFAPGTWGTLFAIPFYLLIQPLALPYYLLLTLIFCILAILICDYVSRAIQVHDHPGMTIDEFAGFFVTMINAPAGFYCLEFLILQSLGRFGF
jgi:phosphatidylglycerophosphatase A